MIHTIMIILGLNDPGGAWYLFWSGFGGDLAEFVLLFAGIRGFMSIKKQHEKHHQQMKDHIDYQVRKLRGLEEKTDTDIMNKEPFDDQAI